MTVNISSAALFVPTDDAGRQLHDDEVTVWSAPQPAAGGDAVPGRPVEPAPSGVMLLNLDELLDELGARVFVAEESAGGPELVAETAWTMRAAADFALDCAEHVLGGSGSASPEISATLSGVVAAARRWLEEAVDVDTGLLGRFSRLAMVRRLRRQGDQLGDLAFDLAVDAEVADVDIFDDPNWTAVAATRDAVLAAVEAVRRDRPGHAGHADSAHREEAASSGADPVSATFETPWGPLNAGLRTAVLPAWAAAGEAAERARQSVADAAGTEASDAERAWQRDRLLHVLRGE